MTSPLSRPAAEFYAPGAHRALVSATILLEVKARSLEKKGLLDQDEFRAIAGATLGGS